jgi:hypothetical protein
MKVSLDLHDIYNQGSEIDKALRQKFDEAVAKKSPLLEIIPGKGSGQLKKHVLRFLEQKRSSMTNMRIEKPSKNFGTIKVHFNWNQRGLRARSRWHCRLGVQRSTSPVSRESTGDAPVPRSPPAAGEQAG